MATNVWSSDTLAADQALLSSKGGGKAKQKTPDGPMAAPWASTLKREGTVGSKKPIWQGGAPPVLLAEPSVPPYKQHMQSSDQKESPI